MSAELMGQVREFLRFQGELKLRGILRTERAPRAESRAPIADERVPAAESPARVATDQPSTHCAICKGRTQVAQDAAASTTRVMFIAEGPGQHAADQLLQRMIVAMELKPGDVHIANVSRCVPTSDLASDDTATCERFLKEQISVVKPEIIVGLGPYATQTLLRDSTPIAQLRGKWRDYEGTPLMPTFHPAYLLGNEAAKRPVWQDLQIVMQRLGSNKPQGT